MSAHTPGPSEVTRRTHAHTPVVLRRDVKHTVYIGKGYKSLFTCPLCLRQTWQPLNFLGRRNVVCHGTKFTKEPKS